MKPKILIIDDEVHIVELIRFNLETSGYDVDFSYDGLDGYLKIKENIPQLVLLDWMLPNISGIDMLQKIRNDKDLSHIPVIMLTAKNMENDKIQGLELGADDYITKPFSVREVVARVKANLRKVEANIEEQVSAQKNQEKKEQKKESTIKVGSLILDLEKYEVHIDGKVIN